MPIGEAQIRVHDARRDPPTRNHTDKPPPHTPTPPSRTRTPPRRTRTRPRARPSPRAPPFQGPQVPVCFVPHLFRARFPRTPTVPSNSFFVQCAGFSSPFLPSFCCLVSLPPHAHLRGYVWQIPYVRRMHPTTQPVPNADDTLSRNILFSDMPSHPPPRMCPNYTYARSETPRRRSCALSLRIPFLRKAFPFPSLFGVCLACRKLARSHATPIDTALVPYWYSFEFISHICPPLPLYIELEARFPTSKPTSAINYMLGITRAEEERASRARQEQESDYITTYQELRVERLCVGPGPEIPARVA
ncbi:hypothetical protein B0H10DRAFT_2033411 [Mycena sp. CBHHK59/15]|nr:hypothetical protein B0H10DRAFT_2033411 [Mycena sp. CBHHK59/15]